MYTLGQNTTDCEKIGYMEKVSREICGEIAPDFCNHCSTRVRTPRTREGKDEIRYHVRSCACGRIKHEAVLVIVRSKPVSAKCGA